MRSSEGVLRLVGDKVDDKVDQELVRARDAVIDRIRHELQALVREAGWTQRRVEAVNGFTPGYLSQVLQGHIALTVRHLYGILLAIEIEPEELFARVHGHSSTDELRERMARYEAVLDQLAQQGLVKPPPSGDEPSG